MTGRSGSESVAAAGSAGVSLDVLGFPLPDLATLVLLRFAPPGMAGHGFSIPLGVGAIIAPVVVVGGQIGSYINSRLSEQMTLRVMITAYLLVGVFVVIRVLCL